ncbi:MAG: terminase [Candidatus Nezhaarchaeales archaeon]
MLNSLTSKELRDLMPFLTPQEREEMDTLLTKGKPLWVPLPGPQTEAYNSEADIIGYGGAAGGGKTDLACGKAITQHKKIAIFRREGTELTAIIDRLEELLGSKDGYNGKDRIWRRRELKWQLEFGSVPNLGDERKYQGRPHDLLVFDEAANFLEAQVRFLLGWLRTTDPNQKCQALFCFNPPTSAEGRWIIEFFAPWLDDLYPNPAQPGEIRWFATMDGKEMEVASGDSFEHDNETITPQSRTFIPSKIKDNPYLMDTGYVTTLQSLPEPLRSQMLNGDFKAGMTDNPWQVIPTSWVDQAMDRWEGKQKKGLMDSMGVDVARGGTDNTIIARRHGVWFNEPMEYPGVETPKGYITAGLVIAARRNRAPVHIDIVGWGSSAYESLETNNIQVIGVNGAEKAWGESNEGGLGFFNRRAELYWRMREALDPNNDNAIALPPHKTLRADLCAPTWSATGGKIKLETKEELIKRIGRSPDHGDAYVLANIETLRDEDFPGQVKGVVHEYDPYA